VSADWAELPAATRGGRDVTLRFPAEEHASRLARARAEMRRRGLAALLVFAQESHYWLTGFDTAGYVFFQAGVIPADERDTVLLTRIPDRRQAEVASLYDDIRVWLNAEHARPAEDLRAILAELGCRGAKVGVAGRAGRLLHARGRLRPGARAAPSEVAGGAGLRAPRRRTGRRGGGGDA
jgi:Xaa-Pro dipeptidase